MSRRSRKVEYCESIGIAMNARFQVSESKLTLVKSHPVFINTPLLTTVQESAVWLYLTEELLLTLCFFSNRLLKKCRSRLERIQTDRGLEFFAIKFQEKFKQYAIKFRPIKPRSLHLNGKVERSQRTDLEEFYPTLDLQDSELRQKLRDW